MKKPHITEFIRRSGGLSEQLTRARQSANLSMRLLGDRMGWTSSKVSKIETGLQIAERPDIERWAEACALGEDQAVSLLAAFDEVNAAFPPIASRARSTRPPVALTPAPDLFSPESPSYRAAYDQGYNDALRDMENQLARLRALAGDEQQPA